MPLSDIHKKKRKKNFFLLALILIFVAVIWIIAMIRIANASEGFPDIYKDQRIEHQIKIEKAAKRYKEQGAAMEKKRDIWRKGINAEREDHQAFIETKAKSYKSRGTEMEQERDVWREKNNKKRADHQKIIEKVAHDFWYGKNAGERANQMRAFKALKAEGASDIEFKDVSDKMKKLKPLPFEE